MFLTFLTSVVTARPATAPTFLGWTPGIRLLMRSRVLDCGCLTGTYATWRNEPMEIIDYRCEACTHEEHRDNAVLS